jgi:1-deoxy-D-xylulose-5-phosphate reductoisomerase
MEIPLSRCLAHPHRIPLNEKALNLVEPDLFEFYAVDRRRFPCLALGESAFAAGLSAPCTFDAANNAAVEAFMRNEIPFSAIPTAIEWALSTANHGNLIDVNVVEEHHREEHRLTMNFLKRRF